MKLTNHKANGIPTINGYYNGNIYFLPKSLSNSGSTDLNWNEVVALAWGAKEILRGNYKQSKYGEIILPFVVLRRLEIVLEATKSEVLKEYEKLKMLDEEIIETRLNQITKQHFHNVSKYNLELLLADPNNIHRNLKAYFRGFSRNVQDIFENFRFDNTIDDLQKQKLLYHMVQHFSRAPLDVESIDNHLMGTIYEELIRRTSEAGNEEAGDHFTPREVIRLMVRLLFSVHKELLQQRHLIRTIYDPAAGTGGMLSEASRYVREINPDIRSEPAGQELNSESYAICKSDMMLKGLDLENIKRGNSLTDEDGFPTKKFHYMLSNPPFGVDWGKYEREIQFEAEKGFGGKYGPGLPKKSDGSFLFLLHMISKMKPHSQGGSRIAIVFNSSPLFVGDVSSGESRIRKWLLENDMLEAIIALPDQLFYNTGIFTYIWIVTNNKNQTRSGKIQLINAVSFYEKLKMSLGQKRNHITNAQIDNIVKFYENFDENDYSKIKENTDFGYTRITVERPLKRNFQVSDERLRRIEHIAFQKFNFSRSKAGKNIISSEKIIEALKTIDQKTIFRNYQQFSILIKKTLSDRGIKPSTELLHKIEDALSERDETSEKEVTNSGEPIPDAQLRDYENVPLKADIDEYFLKEVKRYVPDAWIDESTRNNVGYEIPFSRYFYKMEKIRPLEEIESEIKDLEAEISGGLKELVGS